LILIFYAGNTMKIVIDKEAQTVVVATEGAEKTLPFYSKEAFDLLSELWLATSWHSKYSYTFTWLGRPIIQYPEDLVRLQEIIYRAKPTVIIETGVAHGGSLIYYAGLFKAMGVGRLIIGVDVEIRPHNRSAIEAHELAPLIALVEGNSVSPEIVEKVAMLLRPDDRVLVILDSNHSYAHVTAELEAYSRFVSPDSYLIAMDGIMRLVADSPRAKPSWATDNPANAAEDFVQRDRRYVIESPTWQFNESPLDKPITAWPSAYLRRVA
jgi:cephalosporin hydroxylase